MRYIALLTGNRRDVNTSCPKALLTRIITKNGRLFRDHCWVKLTSEIANIQPRGHQKPIKVYILAKQTQYIKRGIEQSTTLIIKEIRRIK